MDYQINYTKTYDKIFQEREVFFKDQLILAKQLNQTFNYTSNSLLTISNELLTSKLNYFMDDPYLEVMVLFNNRHSIYEDDQINNIIEYSIKPFIAGFENNSTYNLIEIISKIAELDAIKETSRILKNNYDLYNLMFQLNNFTKFELIDYHTNLETLPLFEKLHRKIYPPSKGEKIKISNNNNIEDLFLNVKEVAELTNYAAATIYDLKHKGKIPFYKNGAKLQFKKSEIIEWMEKGKGTTKDDLERKANEYLLKNS
ncbi:AlpA family transcriptional regulator [Lutibacter oceani]|uniref:AlpA family transcriptional regulator n=1 Tax=Lutibacter oceani TaxID=1853311 RepID=A0A3D9RNU8_9FLAO|nr:helix-turn-helix domain-containing protein [Lutibacter oceani]REE81590.1 AlpA family transcriptional regulator [Lutibacter oceani]